MKKWSAADIEKLGQKVPEHSRAVEIPSSAPKGIQHIRASLKLLNIHYVAEFRFHDKRKFRFDFAIPDQKIAIEYEGLHSEKSGHTTIGGYISDVKKYNLAVTSGWRLLRYTANNYKEFEDDLKKLMIQDRTIKA